MHMADSDTFSSIDFLSSILESVPDSLFLLDPETSRILWCNRTAADDLGYTPDEILGHSVLSLQKDVTGLPAWADIAQVIRSADPYVFVGRHRHKQGHEISVEVLTRCIEVDGACLFLSSARNTTLRRTLEGEMLSRDEQVRFALNEASDGLWDWHIPSGEVFFSPQLKRMLGYGPHEMKPTLDTWSHNVHPDDARAVFQAINQHLKGLRERYHAEYRLKNRNGHYVWVNDRGRICERDAQGQPVRMVGMVQNITSQKTLEHQLLQQATHDSLTGLRNRRESEYTLENLVQTCTRMGTPLGVCLFDLDHFKQINDLHGHLVGDQVLVHVAQEVQTRLRASDALFRWGGEEFLLLCPGSDASGVLCIASQLRAAIAALDWSSLHPSLAQVTASFGLAVLPEHGNTPRELLLGADSALYQAKAAGRNQVAHLASSPATTHQVTLETVGLHSPQACSACATPSN
jgi:diguanylate cyclase (GGDEF)-like protein/PAS domain S-box-containing protein